MISNLSELLTFLRTLGVEPKKKLSQNFLIDSNIVAKILKSAFIEKNDTVLEIGPGPGALTESLVAQGVKVYAVEKDFNLANALKRLSNVEVFAQDIRDFDLSILPKNTKVISNLPYHLTAPILTFLAPYEEKFSTITVMVQEEVARRMVARPKTKDYGSLTVFLNFYSELHYAFKVSRNCFYPRPKVDSAVVTLKLKKHPPIDSEGFIHFVRTAFQHRRKMIKTTFGEPIGTILEQLGEDPQSRPEELSLDLFLLLFSMSSAGHEERFIRNPSGVI